MFRKMRRCERLMTEENTFKLLEKEKYGILSTIGSDGYPYGVPLNYVYCDNAIYFHCAKNEGHKIENINNSKKISFTIVGKSDVNSEKFTTNYESVIIFGKISEITENKEIYLEKLIDKFAPEFKEAGMKYINTGGHKAAVYKIDIEHITGKSNL